VNIWANSKKIGYRLPGVHWESIHEKTRAQKSVLLSFQGIDEKYKIRRINSGVQEPVQ
jgi:hypothetical protein